MADGPGAIRIGLGGWDYDPWRETFYPPEVKRADQLGFASRQFRAVEVNATFHRLQKPETWEKWGAAVPDDFRFAIKASRFATNRRDLSDAAEAVGRFCGQGFTLLGSKLGPILWQLPDTKPFDPAELGAFLGMLPTKLDGVSIRHALEVRHESFRSRAFIAMAKAAGVAICVAQGEYPLIPDLTADFVYCRLRHSEDVEAGFEATELDLWARRFQSWSRGEQPEGLAYVSEARVPARSRDVFAFVIGGAKHRNPAAARALLERL